MWSALGDEHERVSAAVLAAFLFAASSRSDLDLNLDLANLRTPPNPTSRPAPHADSPGESAPASPPADGASSPPDASASAAAPSAALESQPEESQPEEPQPEEPQAEEPQAEEPQADGRATSASVTRQPPRVSVDLADMRRRTLSAKPIG